MGYFLFLGTVILSALADIFFSVKCRKEVGILFFDFLITVKGIGRVWFNSPKCHLCGCGTLDAVAGGPGGCGCALGCYRQAEKLMNKANPICPYCGAPIIKVLHVCVKGV